MEETTRKKLGRPLGAKDRKNIFFSPNDTVLVVKGLILLRDEVERQGERVTEHFEQLFTKVSSLAINQLGSSEYLRIAGK